MLLDGASGFWGTGDPNSGTDKPVDPKGGIEITALAVY
jgi:hypothetical protein